MAPGGQGRRARGPRRFPGSAARRRSAGPPCRLRRSPPVPSPEELPRLHGTARVGSPASRFIPRTNRAEDANQYRDTLPSTSMPVGHWPTSPESQNITLSWRRPTGLMEPSPYAAAHTRTEPRGCARYAQDTARPGRTEAALCRPPGPGRAPRSAREGTRPGNVRFRLLPLGLREVPDPPEVRAGLHFPPERGRDRFVPRQPPGQAGRPLHPLLRRRGEDGSGGTAGPVTRVAATAFSFRAAPAAQGHKPCERP
ncbi:unnamed protein product [Coccothraustes coccothraustes]